MKSEYKNDEIIKLIYEYTLKIRRIPTKFDFPNELIPYDYNKINRMGIKLYALKLKEFVEKKDFDINKKSDEQKEIINSLYILCEKLKRPLTRKDLTKDNGINMSYSTILRKGISFYELDFKKYLYNKNPKHCLNCNSTISFKKDSTLDFCNSSCSATYNNKRRIRVKKEINSPYKNIILQKPSNVISKEAIIRKKKKCLWCISELDYSKNKLYCNQTCYENLVFLNKFIDWYNDDNFKIKNPYLIKSFIETIYGYKCASCGISTHEGERIVLQLEHIDGDHLNNKKENVCLLCPNCHSQTDTYKGKNVGKGTRVRRNERYRLGKSY